MKHKVPNVKFRVRELGEWVTKTSDDYFKGKRVVVFGLPGAFTPTCSSKQLPGYETKYNEIKERNIDEVYCISVNDSFVMNAWAEKEHIVNCKMIPDGTGAFTRQMGMLVCKDHLGFGDRSWRYSMVCDDGVCTLFNEEQGRNDTGEDQDPFEVSDAKTLLKQLGDKSFLQDITSNN